MANPVAQRFDRDPQHEWERLERDAYRSLEFTVTMHHLRRHLPAGSKILDAGGGPGRYTRALCRAGHDVVLLDLSAGLIALAREKMAAEPPAVQRRLLESTIGDIGDLSQFDAGRFDAVLCLGGTLSFISEPAGRAEAVAELVRVARPGGLVFLSVMGRLAVLRTILADFSDELLDASLEKLVEQGDSFVKVTGTEWHFFRADELRALAESCGLVTIEMAGCQGLSSNLVEATNRAAEDEAKWERWKELVIETSTEPALVDVSEHMLYIGRAPAIQ